VRLAQIFTGRDIVGDTRQSFGRSTTDTARFVYGSMLIGLNAYMPAPDSVASHLSASDLLRSLGRAEVAHLLSLNSVRADSAVATEVMHRLLGIHFGTADPWPTLDGLGTWGIVNGRSFDSTQRIVFDMRNTTAALRELWSNRGVFRDSGWVAPMAERPVTAILLSEVRQAGQFVTLSMTVGSWTGSGGWANFSSTYVLMRTATGWILVSTGGWVS
jgi:hypothetical protein